MNQAEVRGRNAVIGLALYHNFFSGFSRLVGSLRHYGYDGHIILGVNPQLPLEELEFLKRNKVTLYGVEASECDSSALNGRQERGMIRGKCSKDIPNLKLEWGRYEMARRWLTECETCTGWSMIVDTRDIFFQADPVGLSLLPRSLTLCCTVLISGEVCRRGSADLHRRDCPSLFSSSGPLSIFYLWKHSKPESHRSLLWARILQSLHLPSSAQLRDSNWHEERHASFLVSPRQRVPCQQFEREYKMQVAFHH